MKFFLGFGEVLEGPGTISDDFGQLWKSDFFLSVFDVFWASECLFSLGPWARAREAAVAADWYRGVWGASRNTIATSYAIYGELPLSL